MFTSKGNLHHEEEPFVEKKHGRRVGPLPAPPSTEGSQNTSGGSILYSEKMKT
jgi:hypothetical protein